MAIQDVLTNDRSDQKDISPDLAVAGGMPVNPLSLSNLIFQPIILAGDPNGNPPDTPDSRIDPNTTTSPFAGVGSIRVFLSEDQRFLGSGTPISRRHILTAAHVLDVLNDDGVIDVEPDNVTFNLNFGQNLSSQIRASALNLFPGFTGFNNTIENDIAIITLSSDLPAGVPIYPLHRAPLLPNVALTMVGYGTSGDGITGQTPGTASLTTKRVGQNVTENTELLGLNSIFLFDFDGPTSQTNLFAPLGSELTLGNRIETTVGPGDSGGPSFIQVGNELRLAGVNTFAFALPQGFGLPGSIQGTFGTGGGGVVVSDPAKLTWIDSILAPVTQPGRVQGRVWRDGNGNGIQDTGETGLTGWTVYLDLNQNDRFDSGEPIALTDANGNYAFVNLAAGTYTVATIPQVNWQQTSPSGSATTLFSADFSNETGAPSLDGFAIDNTGAPVAGLWHLSTGRGNDPGHSADDSLYFGQNEGLTGGGNYNVGHTAGRVTSPVINLNGVSGAELSFNYFLRVETPIGSDQPRVRVSRNGGTFQTIASKADVLVPVLNPTWRNATLDLTPFVGSSIQLQFDFNTLDALANNFEGWYIDDVTVRNTGRRSHRVEVRGTETITNLNFGYRPPAALSLPGSDFNGDSRSDIVWRNATTAETTIWLLAETGYSTYFYLPVVPGNWSIAGTADVDGNGTPEIFWRNRDTGENTIWQLNGTSYSTFYSLPVVPSDWVITAIADFNGDGKAEILWRSQAAGLTTLWELSGFTYSTFHLLPTQGAGWTIQSIADFDGDGDRDILWRNTSSGENQIWEMNGLVVSTSHSLLTIDDQNWQIKDTADFDGDGKAEILWRNPVAGLNVIWLLDGFARSSFVYLPAETEPGWTIEDARDFNGDGKAEIFWRNSATGANGIWFMNSLLPTAGIVPVTTSELPVVPGSSWRPVMA